VRSCPASQVTHCLMGYLHNPTDMSENCVVRHLKVSFDKKVGLILSVKIVSFFADAVTIEILYVCTIE
jgi:hypothetical protein